MTDTNPTDGMCPHCGKIVSVKDSLTIYHDDPATKPLRIMCPGSKQRPQAPERGREK